MGKCDTCGKSESCNSKESCQSWIIKYGTAKRIIGVISGKGGVGKSTVTGILAVELKKAGFKVGVLDADITGPSMPRFFGINEKRAGILQQEDSEAVTFIPVETNLGIKVMSLNLLTELEEQPVIWRGPVITGVLSQMYLDTEWGELDYLLIDMPPGTGDVALTVMQSLPINGLVMVAVPQEMVTMIVKKAVIMAEKMDIKVLGVVENMSYVKCENCEERIKIFSKKSAEEQAERLGVPLLAELPIHLELAEKVNQGEAEHFIEQSNEYELLLKNFILQLENK